MIALLLGLHIAEANPKPAGSIGFGACIGAPSGITGKIYVAAGLATQFSLGGDLGQIGDVGLTLDVVQHLPSLNDPVEGYSVPVYLGAGVTASSQVAETTKTYIGLRGVLGLLVTADGLPVEVYIETAPTVYVLGSSISFSWGVDGQLGFRYYF
jgi:hypothetical protein